MRAKESIIKALRRVLRQLAHVTNEKRITGSTTNKWLNKLSVSKLLACSHKVWRLKVLKENCGGIGSSSNHLGCIFSTDAVHVSGSTKC